MVYSIIKESLMKKHAREFWKLVKRNKLVAALVFCGVLILYTGLGFGAYTIVSRQNESGSTSGSQTNATADKNDSTNTDSTPANNQGSSQSSGSQTGSPESKPKATGSTCTRTTIPFNTEYQDSYSLFVGESKVLYQGKNGYVDKCTPDSGGRPVSDTTVPPVTKVVLVGTKPQSSSPPPSQGISYEQAQSNCLAQGTSGTSAYEQCMDAYGY